MSSMKGALCYGLKRVFRYLVPLSLRMKMAIWLDRQWWLASRDYLAKGLVRDLLKENPKEFHKFIWLHHLSGYAQWYDRETVLFDSEQMQPSRKKFFEDLTLTIQMFEMSPSDISSVLEVGCSQGYLLRYLEDKVFTHGPDIVGVDIDAGAIAKGKAYLESVGSNVKLMQGDMEDLAGILNGQAVDFAFAAGVLSYLNEKDALAVMRTMMKHTNVLIAFVGLACSDRHNNKLKQSILSPDHEEQWIHNFDAMIPLSGGTVVKSCWDEGRYYRVFAVPTQRSCEAVSCSP